MKLTVEEILSLQEKYKKEKTEKGIIVTSLYNKNITRFIPSYNIPQLKIKQKKITMSICNNKDPVKLINP